MDGKVNDLDLYDIEAGRYSDLTGEHNRGTFLRYNKYQDGHKAGDAFKKDDPNFKRIILP
jgi:hypothetical protein